MALALDSNVQRVWRSPHALQFGVESPVLVLDPVEAAEERMLAALAGGVTLAALRLVARNAGAPAHTADALVARLAPVLVRSGIRPHRPAPDPLVMLDGVGPTAARIVTLLGAEGVPVRSDVGEDDPEAEASVAVIVAAYAVAPRRHQRWLRRDVPHLAVVLGDTGVTVGPLVRPGAGPCLRCVDLHRRDADPAWPAMAAQLHTLPPPGDGDLIAGAVAAVATGNVLALLRGTSPPAGRAARFDPATGCWSSRSSRPHPECGCLSLGQPLKPLAASQPGNARALA